MSHIDIQDLFDESRFPSGWRLLSLLLYSPVGLALVSVRLLISLQLWLLATLLPDCDVLRTFLNYGFSFVFGIVVRTIPSGECRDKEARIIIANNISALDHFAIYRATEALTPSRWELPSALSNAFGLREMNMTNKDALIADIKEYLSTSHCNVALQPEFGLTNGRVALLKFNLWPFSIERSVQPIVLQAWRPEFACIRLTSIASTWWTDVFWFMFVPCTVFTLTYLNLRRNDDHQALAAQVERDIATYLKIRVSAHTVSDKTEYEKRYILEKTQSRSVASRNSGGAQNVPSLEMQRMARQVSEVLPLVPHNVILRDLLKTRNVDITIANILDGIVTYTPEAAPANVPRAETSVGKVARGATKENAGSLSFEERKAKMIREARERYIQKHGLVDC